MNTLQDLLIILDGQQLSAGYLTPAGNNSAHDTLRALKQQFDPYTLLNSPLPGMTNQPGAPNVLFCPAWVGSLGVGQDAIFLDGVDGKLDLSKAGPAYIFNPTPLAGGGGGGQPGVSNYSLFLPSLTPDHPSNTQANINIGIIFQTTIPGNVIAIRYYRSSGSTLQTQVGAIWAVTGKVKLGQVSFSGQTASGWQQMTLSPPVPIVAGTQYLVSMFLPDGAFVYNASNPAITTGVLQAPAGAGQFDTTAGVLGYPANQQSGVNYMVDLVFQG